MNNSTQSICFKDVQDTLQAIRYARPLPHTSLYKYLIERNVINDRMPDQLQDYQLVTWLTQLVTNQYNQHRQYHGLIELSVKMSKPELMRHLHDDYMLSNAELEAWSVIFVRYVCLPANISTNEHEAIARTTDRTLRRRQKQGIEQAYLQILLG